MSFLLIFAIVVDLILVGLFKILFRRSRPEFNESNDQYYEAPVADKYSFPSGHTSRSSMLSVLFFIIVKPENLGFCMVILMFPIFLGMSRVMMGRHYVSDILGGFILGIYEAYIVLSYSEWWIELANSMLSDYTFNL
uniref:AcidPPc domain-containing protein n=1 Tax=Parastrongyloides trichosuri TaxID=131310 RepID=A0A0N4Z4G3_PARTI